MMMPSDPVYFLLVDDLKENLLSLTALLRREGLVLLEARSGPEALELMLQYDVGLALLDVQMPGMDGFELAELMRGTEKTRHIPIIFLTAGSHDRQRRFRGYETGAVDFLHKPIEPDILRSKANVFFELSLQKMQIARQRDELKIRAEENAVLLAESRQYAEALKEADNRKDEFLATLAHELRNPLAPIRNGLQILHMAPESDSRQVREIMDRQLSHLVRLIDDLLDVSRVSQGKIDLRKAPVTVQDIIQSAVEASEPLIKAGQHSLTIHMPDTLLWLDGDLTRLAQVVSNLLNNAAKYTPDGGAIQLSVEHDGGSDISISIADNGLGIPEDMLTGVFELFRQVERNIENAQGGLGIGLALVLRLVEMHGGTISAHSEGAGKGSVFTVRLPIVSTGIRQDERPDAVDAPNVKTEPLRVLVVDDNIPSAQTTGWMLELIGHESTLAHDGLEAIESARRLKPDVIVMDIGLPGMNGYDVCRELRKDALFKNTVMIAQTGWGQERDRQEALEAGFNHHLVKPVDFQVFSGLLATLKPDSV